MQDGPEYISQWQPKILPDSKQGEREVTTQKSIPEAAPAESLPPSGLTHLKKALTVRYERKM